jgi:hypothetical protein
MVKRELECEAIVDDRSKQEHGCDVGLEHEMSVGFSLPFHIFVDENSGDAAAQKLLPNERPGYG